MDCSSDDEDEDDENNDNEENEGGGAATAGNDESNTQIAVPITHQDLRAANLAEQRAVNLDLEILRVLQPTPTTQPPEEGEEQVFFLYRQPLFFLAFLTLASICSTSLTHMSVLWFFK